MGRGQERRGSDKFFTFFLELLLLFPSSTPPIGLEPKTGGDVSRLTIFFLFAFKKRQAKACESLGCKRQEYSADNICQIMCPQNDSA
jgi:hypothetical protein